MIPTKNTYQTPNEDVRCGEYLLERRYALGKLGSHLSFSKSCTSHMYVSGVSLFRESPIVFEVKPSKPVPYIYREPRVDRSLIYWQLGAKGSKYIGEVEDEGIGKKCSHGYP